MRTRPTTVPITVDPTTITPRPIANNGSASVSVKASPPWKMIATATPIPSAIAAITTATM